MSTAAVAASRAAEEQYEGTRSGPLRRLAGWWARHWVAYVRSLGGTWR